MHEVAAYFGIGFDPILTRPTIFGHDVVVKTSTRMTQAVFVDASDWTTDLTAKERMAIRTAGLAATVWRLLNGRRLRTHAELKALWQERRETP